MKTAVYQPLEERIRAEEQPKYKTERERVKAVKSKLHRLYGAYWNEAGRKKAEAAAVLLCEEAAACGIQEVAKLKTQAAEVLRAHASTRERLPYLDMFYAAVYAAAGATGATGAIGEPITRILDIGCGYNPFTIPWLPGGSGLKVYYACDIDPPTAALQNRFFAALGLPETAFCADIAVETPSQPVDLALLCKMLPVLEAQQKGRGFRLINELNARYIVVTFPLKSLGGREKGMAAHYSAWFEEGMSRELTNFTIVSQQAAGNELVYVISH